MIAESQAYSRGSEKPLSRTARRRIERGFADFLSECTGLQVTEPETAAIHFLGMLKEVAVWPQLLSPTVPL